MLGGITLETPNRADTPGDIVNAAIGLLKEGTIEHTKHYNIRITDRLEAALNTTYQNSKRYYNIFFEPGYAVRIHSHAEGVAVFSVVNIVQGEATQE